MKNKKIRMVLAMHRIPLQGKDRSISLITAIISIRTS